MHQSPYKLHNNETGSPSVTRQEMELFKLLSSEGMSGQELEREIKDVLQELTC